MVDILRDGLIRYLRSRGNNNVREMRQISSFATVIGSWNCVLNSSFKGIDEPFLEELRNCKTQLCRAAGINDNTARDIDLNFGSASLREAGIFDEMIPENNHFQKLFGTYVMRIEDNGDALRFIPALNFSGDPFSHPEERILHVSGRWWVPIKTVGNKTSMLEPISDEQFALRVKVRKAEVEGTKVDGSRVIL